MFWNTLQAKVYGFKLNSLLKDEFIESLNDEFEDKKVDVVNIQVAIRDKKIDNPDDYHVDLITLSKVNFENMILGNVIVDVDNEDNFDKIKGIIDKMGD
ncbi:MAG: hypothetical protein BZ137_09585 [Methanosphaera sp. rholeuAM130]|nr:MAG: hypothetical protein BZ137_09585 [Methanosphaera sp. rholeuAM130]